MTDIVSNRHMQCVLEFIDVNKQLAGFQAQKNKHEIAMANINQLIKELKANRNKKLKQIVGGNLIVEMDGKEAIQMLQKRKEEIDTGIKSLDEQYMHRCDALDTAAIKVFRLIRNKIPKDVLKELVDELE